MIPKIYVGSKNGSDIPTKPTIRFAGRISTVEKLMFELDSPIIEQPNIDVADWLKTL